MRRRAAPSPLSWHRRRAAGRAYAQPTDASTLAEQLFNQSREFARADQWPEACAKFEASLRPPGRCGAGDPGGLLMRRFAWLLALLAAPAGCAQILGLQDVAVEHRVGGRLHGLWDGADGVALQLKTDRITALLTVSANGRFQFPDLLAPGCRTR